MHFFKRSKSGASSDKGQKSDPVEYTPAKTVEQHAADRQHLDSIDDDFWTLTTDRLVQFWYADLPPLYGPLRFFFYGLTWTITMPWFPDPSIPHNTLFSVPRCEFNKQDLLHFPNLGFQYNYESGIFGWFLSRYVEDPSTYWLMNCSMLVGTLQVCIIMCALGFGWKIPRALVAFTYWWMLFMKQSAWSSKNTHSTLLGAFAMVALTFAENNSIDQWSIDSQLMKLYRKYGPQQRQSQSRPHQPYIINGASAGGAARKFVMCVTVIAFLFAGIHKLAEVKWLGWLDGATLKDAVRSQHGHWLWLHNLVKNHDWLCVPMATMTIVGEVGAIAILLSKWWRPFGIATLYGFHIGVYLMMDPNFICHCIDYLLIIEWKKYYERFFGKGIPSKTTIPASEKNIAPLADEESPGENAPTQSSKHAIPRSWKAGAWIYSTVITAAFFAGMFRVDGLPFYSWCLYNHHPSDVVVANPFTQETIEYAAHKCLTQPPLNPACQHLGNYQHHDNFKDFLRHRSRVTAIVEDQNNPNCPIGVYNNWELTLCELSINAAGFPALIKRAVEQQIPEVVNRKPTYLPMAGIGVGMRRTYTDAIAATIEEGSQCFSIDATWYKSHRQYYPSIIYFWGEDRNPYNPASRYARQLRLALEKPENAHKYLGPGKRIRSIAVSFDYIREVFPQDIPLSDMNTCMAGISSVEEEVTNTYGDQQIGNPMSTLPKGDYSKVWAEAFYILLLTVGISFGLRWREILAGLEGMKNGNGFRRRNQLSSKHPIFILLARFMHFVTKFQLPLIFFVASIAVWRFMSPSQASSPWSYEYRTLENKH